jgi:hypothetical protein
MTFRPALPLLLLLAIPAGDLAATSAELDKKLTQWHSLPEAEKPARYEALLSEFEKSHSEKPGDTNILRGAAELSFARKDFGAASKFYYKLLAIHPRACDAHVRLGIIAANGGDTGRAREELAAELSNCPSGNAYVEQLRAKVPAVTSPSPSSPPAAAAENPAQARIDRLRSEWLKEYTAYHPELNRDAPLALCPEEKSYTACAWAKLGKEKLRFPEQIAVETSFMVRSAVADRKTGTLRRDEALLAGCENVLRVLKKEPNYPIRDLGSMKPEEQPKQEREQEEILFASHRRFSSIAIQGMESFLEQFDKEFPVPTQEQKTRKESIRAGIRQIQAK